MSSARQMMPPEFAPHERTVMCWPQRTEIWQPSIEAAEEAFAEIARTIARFEPVTMAVDPSRSARAQQLCGDITQIVEIPLDDSWARDTAPLWTWRGDRDMVAVDFTFNGWGGKFSHAADDAMASQLATHLQFDIVRSEMVLEGGSISVDGAGNLVTTMQCLLNPNRNPQMSMIDIEMALSRELGIDAVLWLPHGLSLDHDTDGHVDNVAAFVAPYHLLLQGCSDGAEEDHLRMRINEQVARSAYSAEGSPFRVDVIPVLPFVETAHGRRVVPYLNFYIGNGFVLVPVCGHPADDEMVSMIDSVFPRREVIAMNVGELLALGGGGIHCITQQVPMARY